MDFHALLTKLSDGQYHSGTDIGRVLGVSRTAVWKALSRLQEWGVVVESHKGLGYRIPGGLDLLGNSIIERGLPERIVSHISFETLLSCTSTNELLLQEDSLPANGYRFVFSEQQTAGRGRRGRSWVSPFAQNLYFSVGFEFRGGVYKLAGLSLVVGIACAKALESLGVQGLQLKWPNDVWLDQRKLAGVLVELRGEPTTAWQVVVGVGLNVHMSAELGADIEQPWISLSEIKRFSRNDLAIAMIGRLYECIEQFKDTGFSAFLSDWASFDALKGKRVTINDGAKQGIAVGVDVTGALLLDAGSGIEPVNAGEVSVRAQ